MKRFFFLLIALAPLALFAQNPSGLKGDQLKLRNELFTFLKEEGYSPRIDSDGSVLFSEKGSEYCFEVSEIDENPLYVVFSKYFDYPKEYSQEVILLATRELNRYKAVKVVCFDDSFRIGAEMYVRNAEPVKSAFYKIKDMIEYVVSDFIEECDAVKERYKTTGIVGGTFALSSDICCF